MGDVREQNPEENVSTTCLTSMIPPRISFIYGYITAKTKFVLISSQRETLIFAVT